MNGPVAVNGKVAASGNLSNEDTQRHDREAQKESEELGNFSSTVCVFVLSAGLQCGITSTLHRI